MILGIFSFAYFFQLLAAASAVGALYFGLRKRKHAAQRAALFLLAALNCAQHLFKAFLWKPYFGTGFSFENTAYNACAFLILATPFGLCRENGEFSCFLSCVGTAAGFLPLLAPRWFWGQTIVQWEFVRMWTCHVLLAATSLLPVLWKHVRLRFSSCALIAVPFFGMLACVLLNNALWASAMEPAAARAFLLAQDPMWVLPPRSPSALRTFLASAPLFRLADAPLLWYFVPVSLAVTAAGCLVGFAADASLLPWEPRFLRKIL